MSLTDSARLVLPRGDVVVGESIVKLTSMVERMGMQLLLQVRENACGIKAFEPAKATPLAMLLRSGQQAAKHLESSTR